jgi:hypothetical protein
MVCIFQALSCIRKCVPSHRAVIAKESAGRALLLGSNLDYDRCSLINIVLVNGLERAATRVASQLVSEMLVSSDMLRFPAGK